MRKIAKIAALLAAFSLALGFVSCSNSSDGPGYVPGPTGAYTVTVTGGTATPSSAAAGTTITIKADNPSEGKAFYKWTTTTAGVKFASATSAETTFVMPASNVAVTANFNSTLDLSTLTADTVIKDNTIVTGTLGANVKISIADGATVTLKDVTINGTDSDSYKWAGLTCAGDATITLEGTNTVKGFWKYYPGLFVPKGKTLTIKGSGSLAADSNGRGAGIGGCYADDYTHIPKEEGSCGTIVIEGGTITATGGLAAGIGCGYYSDCDGVTIKGGTVTATSGVYAAGIGSSQGGSCGPISITGGTVTATSVEDGAGVGTGRGSDSKCGAITVTDGVTKFTATKGHDTADSVGLGRDCGDCGTVTIGGVVYLEDSVYQNDGAAVLGQSPFVYKPNFKPMEQATADDIGKVIGADGYIYANKAAAEAEGTTASAMIAYVGSATEPTNSNINASMEGHAHGLAIALGPAGSWQSSWSAAKTSAASYAAARPARASTWRLPSAYQWMWMLKGCGSNITPKADIGNAFEFQNGNISNLSQACGGGSIYNKYWTSTEKDGSNAYECRCDEQHKFQSASKSQGESAGIWAIAIFAF